MNHSSSVAQTLSRSPTVGVRVSLCVCVCHTYCSLIERYLLCDPIATMLAPVVAAVVVIKFALKKN